MFSPQQLAAVGSIGPEGLDRGFGAAEFFGGFLSEVRRSEAVGDATCIGVFFLLFVCGTPQTLLPCCVCILLGGLGLSSNPEQVYVRSLWPGRLPRVP